MIHRSLGFRLAVIVGLALSAGLAIHFVSSMTHHESALLNLKREEAHILSDTIKASLTHAMLQGKAGRDAIHDAIADVSTREEIERVRIFNAVGNIQYSSDPSEMGRVVNKDAENCRQCHSGGSQPASRMERSRFFYTPSGSGGVPYRVLGVINPIYNEAEKGCLNCHQDQTVLGVLDVVVSLRTVDSDISYHRSRLLLFGTIGVIGIIAVVALLIHFLVHRPVAQIVDGTRRVGDLELDHRIPADRKDELGNLARGFNVMTARLQEAQQKIRGFTAHMRQKVEEKTEELRSTQAQMVRTEKMAAIGQMAAGVAHEINNPLTGVITFAHLLKRKAEPDSQESEDLDTIIEEAERCAKIARGLLDFARGGQLVRSEADMALLLDRTLTLVEHQALFHNIEIVKDYAENVPRISIDRDRIAQVFLNLIMNAAESMDGEGRLTLRTSFGGVRVRVDIRDTGPGIPAEMQSRVYDPFFTTKEAGQGTGLGLSVSYRIVEDHGGLLRLESAPGKGTCFSVLLPVKPSRGEE